ncbi:unnamed protein product, partial [Meganyctiphanes norvegica]
MLMRRSVCVAHNLTWLNSHIYKSLEMPFYAVAKGKAPGIYATWPDCEEQVKGFHAPKFKKFNTKPEAEDFIKQFGNSKSIDTKSESDPIASTIKSQLARIIEVAVKMNKRPRDNVMVNISITKNARVEEDGRMSPTLVSMQKDMKRLQKELSVLRDRFDNYVGGTRGIHTSSESKAKKRKRNPGSVDTDSDGPSSSTDPNDTNKFEVDSDGFLIVYTDGACEGNGKSGARAGVGVYFGPGHPLNVSEPVRGRATNNTAEIQACTYALELAHASGFKKVKVSSDSMFTINCMTKWIKKWQKNGWMKTDGKPVINKEDLVALDQATDGLCVKWNYVKAHAGIPGNEAADRLAVGGAQRYVPGQ